VMENARERTITVSVWNERCKITVYQKLETVWIAVGDYKGERIDVKSSSERSAITAWKETARYRGN
jgi:hypothetical protein